MSEHFMFSQTLPGGLSGAKIEQAWEPSVPVEEAVAQELGRASLFGVIGDAPLVSRPGYDGVPGPQPVATPSTNLRIFSAR